jgi:hypothetical protein
MILQIMFETHFQEKCTQVFIDNFMYGIHYTLGAIQNTIGRYKCILIIN